MIGITGCGYHVPFSRLARREIARAWNRRTGNGERAAVNFDEDALTLGYEAARNSREHLGTGEIDGVFFASTSAPFWQRSVAASLSATLDLPYSSETVDFAGTLRASTAAFRAATDAIVSNRLSSVLVVGSDVREGRPGGEDEDRYGDAAGAVTVGKDGVLAEILGTRSCSSDFWDEWRRDVDSFVQTQNSRFTTERGYHKNIVQVGKQLLADCGIRPEQISKAVVPSPDGRAHLGAAAALGFREGQILDPKFAEIGAVGASAPFLLAAMALETAVPGELVLVFSYGDGADAILLRVTEEIRNRPLLSSLAEHLEEKNLYPSYSIYRKMRSYYQDNIEASELSNVLLEKEESQNIRLHGTLCLSCNTRQYPITKICGACRNHDSLQEVPLDRKGRVFTFTRDHLYAGPETATVMAVVDLDNGGRMYLQMTDVDTEDVSIGDPVILTMRRRKESQTMHNYYWKCRPIR